MAATAQNIPDAPQAGALTIGELARTIRRNGVLFWSIVFTGLAIGVAVSLLMPPAYIAQTEVLVEAPGQNGTAPTPDLVVGEISVPGATYGIETQIELLQSQAIYRDVYESLGKSWPTTIVAFEKLPKVAIRQKNKSTVFTINVEGEDQEEIVQIASRFPETFNNYLREIKSESVGRGREFIENRLTTEREALAAAEQALADFKSTNQVIDTGAELEKRVAESRSADERVLSARQDLNTANAAVERISQELANLPPTRETEIVRTNNETLERNKALLADLERDRASLAEIYQDDAREMRQIDAQIAKQRAFIDELEDNLTTVTTETNPQLDQIRNQLIQARISREAAQTNYDVALTLAAEREVNLNELGDLARQQRDLERSIALSNESVTTLTQVLNRLATRDNEISQSVRSLTPQTFSDQIRPNWLVNMTLAGLIALGIAFVVALARDSVKDKVNSDDEAIALSKLDIITRIPQRPGGRSQLISDPETSVAFESYRVLRSIIGLMENQSPIHSLIVTSTTRGEGKTVVSSNLAVAFALNQQRVILVDANFRNSQVHGLFGKPEQPGLGDVLLGEKTVDEVLITTEIDGLQIVPAGKHPQNATEAVGSARMSALIEQLEGKCDLVIIDTASTLGIADTPSLAALTDASLLVLRTGKPSKGEFNDAVGLLNAASPRLLGLVVNGVPAKQARLENA